MEGYNFMKTSVQKSLDPCNLFIKNLWNNCTQIQLDDLFKPYGIIIRSRMLQDGIGFVQYEMPIQAELAIQQLNGRKLNGCKEPLLIKHAYLKNKVPKTVIKYENQEIQMIYHDNNKNVYIRGVPDYYTQKDFYNLCQYYGKISCISLCSKFNSGFVRFSNGSEAQKCIHCLHLSYLPGCSNPLIVKLANNDPFEPKVELRTKSLPGEIIPDLNLMNNMNGFPSTTTTATATFIPYKNSSLLPCNSYSNFQPSSPAPSNSTISTTNTGSAITTTSTVYKSSQTLINKNNMTFIPVCQIPQDIMVNILQNLNL